jgi:predicted nucleic acid-binding protein
VIALLDNTVLSNFAVAGRVDLLRLALGDDAAAPPEVLAELQAGIDLGRLPPNDWSWLAILSLAESERAVYEQLLERLNAGEAACLALARRRGYRVFTDDRDAHGQQTQVSLLTQSTDSM